MGFSLFYCDLCEEEDLKNRLVLRTKKVKPQAFHTVNELQEHKVTNHCAFTPISEGNVNGIRSHPDSIKVRIDD